MEKAKLQTPMMAIRMAGTMAKSMRMAMMALAGWVTTSFALAEM